MTVVIIVVITAALAFHSGHSVADHRHGRAHGKRGINLYWSSVIDPWISIPGPFGTRSGTPEPHHRGQPRKLEDRDMSHFPGDPSR